MLKKTLLATAVGAALVLGVVPTVSAGGGPPPWTTVSMVQCQNLIFKRGQVWQNFPVVNGIDVDAEIARLVGELKDSIAGNWNANNVPCSLALAALIDAARQNCTRDRGQIAEIFPSKMTENAQGTTHKSEVFCEAINEGGLPPADED